MHLLDMSSTYQIFLSSQLHSPIPEQFRNPSRSGVRSVHSCSLRLEACQEPLIVLATSWHRRSLPPSSAPGLTGVERREVDTLRGHMNDVSCVLFHGRLDVVVSSSEDKSIRVWDATKGTCLHTLSKEHCQFRILSLYPELNLLATGHDSGMIVFKLERERPAFSVSRDSVIFVKDRFLRVFDYSTHKDVRLTPILRPGSHTLNQGPRTLSYCPTGNAVLVLLDVDGGSYELYVIRKDGYGGGNTIQEAKRGVGGLAVGVCYQK